MVSKGERHQLQEVLPRGRHEPETRPGRPFAAESAPVFRFLELVVKSHELKVRSSIGNWQHVFHPLSLMSWGSLA